MRRVALVALLVCSLLAPSTAVATGAADPSTATAVSASTVDYPDVNRTVELSLSPDAPGHIRVVARYRIPETVESLSVVMPRDGTVLDAQGFEARDRRTYEWTGTDRTAKLVLRLSVNETFQRAVDQKRGPDEGRGLAFADPGPWAIVRVPTFPTRWRAPRSTNLDHSVAIDGSGATGGSVAYLGPYTEHTRETPDGTVRLVVPDAATLRPPPTELFDSISHAANGLNLGAAPGDSLLIAAPTTVEWGVAGAAIRADAWVRASQPLSMPDNVWLHEYIHTRQTFGTTNETRWASEAAAEYYAALLTLQQGRISHAEFRAHLRRGTRTDAVLSRPETWRATNADYTKGALVLGAIDRQMRLAADGGTLQAVLRRAGTDTLTSSEFFGGIEAVAGAETREYARRFVTTDAVPSLWNASQHAAAFGRVAVMRTDVRSVQATGPYGNRTLGNATATLAVGERLTTRIAVSNTGTAQGAYDLPLSVDGRAVSNASGRLAPGESTTVTLSHRFDRVGIHSVRFANRTLTVSVRKPAAPAVESVSMPENVTVGENATVTVSVANRAERPAAGDVVLLVDGEVAARRSVSLAPGGETTLSMSVRFTEPGRHQVLVGERTSVIRVVPRETTASGSGPGFGALAAVVGVALGVIACRR